MTRCVICRSDFKRRSMTQKACSPDCAERYGREKAIADADKQKRKEDKADRLDTRERKEKLKSKSDELDRAWWPACMRPKALEFASTPS